MAYRSEEELIELMSIEQSRIPSCHQSGPVCLHERSYQQGELDQPFAHAWQEAKGIVEVTTVDL